MTLPITYTQWEAYIAIHLGMPLLVYADADHASITHPQRAHLDRLQEMVRFASSFDDHSALQSMVMADLMAHFRLNSVTAQIPAALKPSNLPSGYIGRLFLGRDEFLESLRASLTGTTHATAITQKAAATGISGLGGIGKTHAAVEYAHRYRDDYNALLFASADSPEKLQSSLAALCEVLRLDENGNLPPDESIRVRAALDWLASHSGWLLILDNADDEPAAKAVQEILGHFTNGHVLITSRLHGWSDQVKNLDLEVLSETAAAELILQLTANRRRLAPDDETQARQLAQLLEGLPLAIHQAAGFINEQTLTLAAYQTRYKEEAAELLNWFNDLSIPYECPEKLAPRPVLVTWNTSFDKLSEQDRYWLCIFSYFAPDPIPEFLLEPTNSATLAQKAMLQNARDSISRAEKYCLLSRSRSEPVFKIHRLVQQITRLQFSPGEYGSALGIAIGLIVQSDPGNPHDVSSWVKWNLLQSHAIALCTHSSDEQSPTGLNRLLNFLGNLFAAKCLFPKAEECFLRTLRIQRLIVGKDHLDIATDLNNLGQLYVATNRLSEAEPLMREALRIIRLGFNKPHPRVAQQLINLAGVLKESQRFSEAEPLMREALGIAETTLGHHHEHVAICLNNLAQLLQATDRLAEAEPLMWDALQIDLGIFGGDHPNVATRLNNLSGLLQLTGRFAEAEPLIINALRIVRAAYGDDHLRVGIILSNLAQLYKATNRLAEAEPLMRDALRIVHVSLGPEHPNSVIASRNLELLLAEIAESPPNV